jgi:hypothetical protein
MPAHTTAALAAYPEYSCTGGPFSVTTGALWPITDIYCAGNDSTFTFLQDVLSEVMDLFPGQYIHIGGDEADKTNWKKWALVGSALVLLGMLTAAGFLWFLHATQDPFASFATVAVNPETVLSIVPPDTDDNPDADISVDDPTVPPVEPGMNQPPPMIEPMGIRPPPILVMHPDMAVEEMRSFDLDPFPQGNVKVFLNEKELGQWGPQPPAISRVRVGAGTHTLMFTHPLCYAKSITIPAGMSSSRLHVRLNWRPARVIVHAPPGTAIAVHILEGEPRTLPGLPGTTLEIPFPEVWDSSSLQAKVIAAGNSLSHREKAITLLAGRLIRVDMEVP